MIERVYLRVDGWLINELIILIIIIFILLLFSKLLLLLLEIGKVVI